jgi:hypothetical protein
MTNPEAELRLLVGLEIRMERSYDNSIIDVSFDLSRTASRSVGQGTLPRTSEVSPGSLALLAAFSINADWR